MVSLEGTLEKRGAWKRWAEVKLQLTDTKIAVLEKSVQKDINTIAHVERLSSNQKGEAFAFALHLSDSSGYVKTILNLIYVSFTTKKTQQNQPITQVGPPR